MIRKHKSIDGVKLKEKLQADTYDIHIRLHNHPLMRPLQNVTPLSKKHYQTVLHAFFDFYTTWENHFSVTAPRYAEEAKPLNWLEKDFSALKVNVPSVFPKNCHHGTDFSSYLGYLYVKQGATLGGQVISAHLERTLGLEKNKTIFFFNGYGKSTGKSWRNFQSYMLQHEQNVVWEEVVESAKNVFSNIESVFTRYYQNNDKEAT